MQGYIISDEEITDILENVNPTADKDEHGRFIIGGNISCYLSGDRGIAIGDDVVYFHGESEYSIKAVLSSARYYRERLVTLVSGNKNRSVNARP